MDVQIHRFVIGVTSCYIIRHEGMILIDAGNTNQEPNFMKAFDRLAIQPEEIQLILATHGHADHIGSAKALKELTGAPIAIHQAEMDWLEQGLVVAPPGVTPWGHVMSSMFGVAKKIFQFQPVKVDIVFGDDAFSLDEFGIPGKVIPTPGHSPGSVSVVLETNDAFVGDLAMNGLPFRLNPGLPILAEDINEVKDSWRKILRLGLKTIFPGHGKPFPAEVMSKAAQSWTNNR